MKIRAKLLSSFLACSLVPMGILGAVNYWNARDAAILVRDRSIEGLHEAAKAKLAGIGAVKKAQVTEYFENAERQVRSLSQSPQTIAAMRSLNLGFKSFIEDRKLSGSDVPDDKSQLRGYYQSTFGSEYTKNNPSKNPDTESRFSQLSSQAIALQHTFIAINSNPLGSKQMLDASAFNTKYDNYHKANHPYFRSIVEQFGYYDIFLIDSESGDIVYTVFKEVDFATNLNNGPYSRTNLGEVFRKANVLSQSSEPVLVDFACYYPSYDAPASFIAVPLFDGERRIGVMAIQMPIDRINQVMNVGETLGENGESYLVAMDGLPRSDSKMDTKNRTITKAFLNPANGQMKSEAIENGLAGKTGVLVEKNYLGTETLSAFAPIDVLGLKWTVVTEEPTESALQAAVSVVEATQKAQSSLLFWAFAMLIGSSAIVFPFAYWIVRNLMSPINATIATLRDIAEGEGDLTRRLDEARGDELGEMAKWFNAFADRIHDVVCTISTNAQLLASSSHQLSATAEQLSNGVSSSKQQSASVSAAAEQMSVNMREVADSTDGMSQTIRAVAASVEEMNQTIREIARNAEKSATVAGQAAKLVEVSNDKISNLGEAADEIGKVIEVIQDIAEQTNLLALNATIEAARAGEAGKGFAVVATEVKELAKQTAAATDDIRSRIEAMQASTGEAVDSIREISQVINNVNEVSRTIASAVEEQSITTRQISDNVGTTASAAESVARGVAETALASREITENITRVDGVLMQTAEGADESRDAGSRLSELASEMNGLIGRFKTRQNQDSARYIPAEPRKV
jgi:methyl-accepting chemotaxis protein